MKLGLYVSLAISLSPNLVLNDPFPLFYQPIFYPLDHVQYGCFFMQMSEWNGGICKLWQQLMYTLKRTVKGRAHLGDFWFLMIDSYHDW